MKTYQIQITPITKSKMCGAKPHVIELKTEDIERSMSQYQRNRDAFNWEIIEVNE